MTIAHLSHHGLKMLKKTNTSVVLEGTRAACLRMAAAHGMEIDRKEGKTIAINGGRALLAPCGENDWTTCWMKGGGLIQKGRDGYCLVMPIGVWNEN